jgi:hypothetical protein
LEGEIESLEGGLKATICESLEVRLKAAIVIFNHHWRAKEVRRTIFWSGCLVHTMNLLMHDIIKMKDHDYRWIGALPWPTSFSAITPIWSY